MEIKVTEKIKRKLRDTLAEHLRLLEKEMKYSPDLRRQDILDIRNANITKVEKMLTMEYLDI
jgi:hypothetical protein